MATASKQGWALVALDCAVDTTTPAGEAMANVLATFAQFERRLIGQRTREALAAKRASGVRLGRPVSLPSAVSKRIAAEREGWALARGHRGHAQRRAGADRPGRSTVVAVNGARRAARVRCLSSLEFDLSDRLRDTHRVMSEESTTPDLVELTRGRVEAANRRDFDAMVSFFAPDAVWDLSPMGLGDLRGRRRDSRLLRRLDGAVRGVRSRGRGDSRSRQRRHVSPGHLQGPSGGKRRRGSACATRPVNCGQRR